MLKEDWEAYPFAYGFFTARNGVKVLPESQEKRSLSKTLLIT